mgnify:CR=1 FL=1
MLQKQYTDRTDLEKLKSQWRKLSGLHRRAEWSAAIVRAATSTEISANFAIRLEFAAKSSLSSKFIDSQLQWANGLAGKIDHLLEPLWLSDKEKHKQIKALRSLAKHINAKRNAVVHQGEFCNEGEAQKVIEDARTFIQLVVQQYEPDFSIPEPWKTSNR